MAKKVFIKLENPCSQNWEHMLATDEGRFCKNCKKTIIDFTGLSDTEIILNFNLSNNNTCGRFYKRQLERQIQISHSIKKKYHLPKIFASVILLPYYQTLQKVKL